MDIVRIFFAISNLFLLSNLNAVSDSEISRQQNFAYEAINKFAETKANDGLQLCGIGGASKDGKKTGFELIFQTGKLFELKEARELLLKLATEFLEDINKNEQLRPYLFQYPYPIENIRIAVLSNKYFFERDKYLASFSINKARLGFAKGSEFDAGIINLDSAETYEEALKIVAASCENKLNSSEIK